MRQRTKREVEIYKAAMDPGQDEGMMYAQAFCKGAAWADANSVCSRCSGNDQNPQTGAADLEEALKTIADLKLELRQNYREINKLEHLLQVEKTLVDNLMNSMRNE